MSWCEKN